MLRVASYNIHKAVGLDRIRDPERILAVIGEVNADIVALQEADLRFGRRITALPLNMIEASPWTTVPLDTRPDSIGWHGNAILVRDGSTVLHSEVIPLPTLEPRGAIMAEVESATHGRVRVVAMHLDLSGFRRRQQARAIIAHLERFHTAMPTVLMGDLNDWSRTGGAIGEFGKCFDVLRPGNSFHSRRPVAALDRIMVTPGTSVDSCGVHHSLLASQASDHLPVWAVFDI